MDGGWDYARIQQALARADDSINVKFVYRRLQLIARGLVVMTFIDDALRVITDYNGQVTTMRGVRWGKHFGGVYFWSHLIPVLCVLAQASGATMVLAELRPQAGCLILIAFSALHPFLYQQQGNLEFLLESVTIIGGLLILLSSDRAKARARAKLLLAEREEEEQQKDRLLLAGRVCVSAVFVHYVAKMIYERSSKHDDPLDAAVDGVLLILLAVITGLIVVGIKSRWCAALLALIMALSALYKHPWFITMWSKESFKLDFVVGYESVDVSAWLYSDHQRYFFFQQLSTVGALMQLAVHGPGKYSLDEAEAEPFNLETITSKGAE